VDIISRIVERVSAQRYVHIGSDDFEVDLRTGQIDFVFTHTSYEECYNDSIEGSLLQELYDALKTVFGPAPTGPSTFEYSYEYPNDDGWFSFEFRNGVLLYEACSGYSSMSAGGELSPEQSKELYIAMYHWYSANSERTEPEKTYAPL
jgi:hypothetical protein